MSEAETKTDNSTQAAKITNIFVLMLENHSFDNIFAMSGIDGIKAATTNDSNSWSPPDQSLMLTAHVRDGAPTVRLPPERTQIDATADQHREPQANLQHRARADAGIASSQQGQLPDYDDSGTRQEDGGRRFVEPTLDIVERQPAEGEEPPRGQLAEDEEKAVGEVRHGGAMLERSD